MRLHRLLDAGFQQENRKRYESACGSMRDGVEEGHTSAPQTRIAARGSCLRAGGGRAARCAAQYSIPAPRRPDRRRLLCARGSRQESPRAVSSRRCLYTSTAPMLPKNVSLDAVPIRLMSVNSSVTRGQAPASGFGVQAVRWDRGDGRRSSRSAAQSPPLPGCAWRRPGRYRRGSALAAPRRVRRRPHPLP